MGYQRICVKPHLMAPHLSFDEVDFHWCHFCLVSLLVQAHNLPRNKMNKANAVLLGQFIGKFILVDEGALTEKVQKFIRIRVAVDTSASLKAGCLIHRDDAPPSMVHFKYERLPEFCYT